MGGVSARASGPATMRSERRAVPWGPCTVNVTRSRPRSLNLAADDSRVGIDDEAGGRGSAENRSGGVPVAGTRNRNGRPGVAPVTRGP